MRRSQTGDSGSKESSCSSWKTPDEVWGLGRYIIFCIQYSKNENLKVMSVVDIHLLKMCKLLLSYSKSKENEICILLQILFMKILKIVI